MTEEQKIKLRRRINDYLCKYATVEELEQIAVILWKKHRIREVV